MAESPEARGSLSACLVSDHVFVPYLMIAAALKTLNPY
jgi:hypothetical protein